MTLKKIVFLSEKKIKAEKTLQEIIKDTEQLVSEKKLESLEGFLSKKSLVKIISKSLYSRIQSTHDFIFDDNHSEKIGQILNNKNQSFYFSSPHLMMHYPNDDEESSKFHIDSRKGIGRTLTLWEPFKAPKGNQRLRVIKGSEYLSRLPLLGNLSVKFYQSVPETFFGTMLDLGEGESLIFDANTIHKGNVNNQKNIFLTNVVRLSLFPYTEGGYCKATRGIENNKYNLFFNYGNKYQDYDKEILFSCVNILNSLSIRESDILISDKVNQIYSKNISNVGCFDALASNLLLFMCKYFKDQKVQQSFLLKSLEFNPNNVATFYDILNILNTTEIDSIYKNITKNSCSASILYTLGTKQNSLEKSNTCFEIASLYDSNFDIKH